MTVKKPEDVLAAIATELDGRTWTPDTIDRIATILRDAGYAIRELDVFERPAYPTFPRPHYWAVVPYTRSEDTASIRIERAKDPQTAAKLAFGRGGLLVYYKDLGTSVRVIQSDAKRMALLTDSEDWEPLRIAR